MCLRYTGILELGVIYSDMGFYKIQKFWIQTRMKQATIIRKFRINYRTKSQTARIWKFQINYKIKQLEFGNSKLTTRQKTRQLEFGNSEFNRRQPYQEKDKSEFSSLKYEIFEFITLQLYKHLLSPHFNPLNALQECIIKGEKKRERGERNGK